MLFGRQAHSQIFVLKADSNRRTYLVATGLWLLISLATVVMACVVAPQPEPLLKVVPIVLYCSYRTYSSARKVVLSAA